MSGVQEHRRLTERGARMLQRVAALRKDPQPSTPAPPESEEAVNAFELQRLRQRVDHLEAEIEGLQDSMHREAQRHDREVGDLRRQIQPDELARSLSTDARRRGI